MNCKCYRGHSNHPSAPRGKSYVLRRTEFCHQLVNAQRLAGEIDCRHHVYYQAHKQAKPIEEIILKTLRRYSAALAALRILVNGNLIVLGIPPAANEPMSMHYPPPCPIETRLLIYRTFNQAMKEWCEANQIKYLDVQSVGGDERGYFRDGYTEETSPNFPTHLNKARMRPLVLEMLNR